MFSLIDPASTFDIYRYLMINTAAATQARQRIASGYRINSAADDAAGLAISTGLQSQISGMKQAVLNSQAGTNVVQTASSALGQSTSILQQMMTLAVQAANTAGQTPATLSTIQSQIMQLNSQLTGIANGTTFNGAKLLDGSYTGKQFQVGSNPGDVLTVSIGTGVTAAQLGVATIDVTGTAAGSMTATATAATTTAQSNVTTTLTAPSFGVGGSSWANLSGTIAMNGVSLDLSTVKSTTGGTPALTDLNSALAATFGTNSSGTAYVTASVNGTSGQLVFTGPATSSSNTSSQLAAISLTFTQQSGAQAAITAIKNATTTVANLQSSLGGTVNAFQNQINYLNQSVTSATASDTAIRGANVALEQSNLVQAQVLQQADAAMLAQAQQTPNTVLRILLGLP